VKWCVPSCHLGKAQQWHVLFRTVAMPELLHSSKMKCPFRIISGPRAEAAAMSGLPR
jgi:hypothetical protein